MFENLFKYLVSSAVFSIVGILILIISFIIVEKITPENLWKKVAEENNVALAILGAAFMIAIAIIIASAIHG
ncbi:MAG: DUF350 domain-containing protein [Flavobacteriales bacterium]